MRSRITRRALLGGASLLALAQGANAHLLMLRGGGSSGGGGGTTITNLVVTETSGSNQTNVPITFGLPLAAGVLGSAQKIQVYAADGVAPIVTQEDNRSSDVTPSVRFVAVTCILPSLAANATVSLPIQILSGSPSTGTDIAISDILATSYDYTVQAVDPTGTWSASARAGLNSSNTGWANLTTATVLGTWRSGGGYCTEYIVYVPLTSGASTHPNLRAVFHICAFKGQSGAVSVSNPILAIRTDRILENGVVQASSPADNWYGLTDTCGTNTVSWGNSTPSVNLTLSIDTAGHSGICTAASSLFTQNSVGSLITDGTGVCTITDYTSPTVVQVNVYASFSSTSVPGGSYTIYGINHANGATNYQRYWWTGLATPQVSTNLGTAWNGTSQSGGPFAYINSTELVPNFTFAASTVNNTVSNLISGTNKQGTNPSGYWSHSIGNGFAGDYTMDIEQTGEVPPIGIFPQWEAQALVRWDQYAPTVLFGNAQKARLMPFFYRDQNTGLTPTLDNGDSYVTEAAWAGTNQTLINTPAGYIAGWSPSGNPISAIPANCSHMGEPYYISYLLTGDFVWGEAQVFHGFGMWLGTGNPSYQGLGLNRLSWTAQDGIRGGAWGIRSVAHTALLIPDRSPSVLGWTKAKAQTWLSNHYTATNSGTYNVGPFPGALISYLNNTGPGKTFATDGPRWTALNAGMYAQFMLGYMVFSMSHLRECGMLDATNGIATHEWFATGVIGACNDTSSVNPKYMVPAYWVLTQWPDGTQLSSWAAAYQSAAVGTMSSGGIGNTRQINGVASVSGSGASTLITMPTGNFTGGTAFYAGGAVLDTAQLSVINTPTVNAGGTGYVTGDTVTLTVSGFSYAPTVTRKAVATVTASGGVVTAVSISDPGLYVYNYLTGSGHASMTNGTAAQFSTSGSGSGLTLSGVSCQYGQGFITSISGDTLTVNVTTSETHGGVTLQGYPFANTSLVANGYLVPWSAPGDPVGSEIAPYFASPSNDYIQIAQACYEYLSQFGISGASSALSMALGWTGGSMYISDQKWQIAARA